jgi:hypothetical protein
MNHSSDEVQNAKPDENVLQPPGEYIGEWVFKIIGVYKRNNDQYERWDETYPAKESESYNQPVFLRKDQTQVDQ